MMNILLAEECPNTGGTMTALDKLLSVAGESIGDPSDIVELSEIEVAGSLTSDFFRIFERKNGFYAFENALHILSVIKKGSEIELLSWNSLGLWRNSYEVLVPECVFFAEDAFGFQFCIMSDGVYLFDLETTRFDFLAKDIEE